MSFPFLGAEFTFRQPDGTTLQVRGWGDQHRAVFETLDGYTVVRDPATGFYEYASVTDDGDEFRPTGLRPGMAVPEAAGLTAGARVNPRAARAQAMEGVGLPTPRWQRRREESRTALRTALRTG
jgi:hypothetical protein